MDVEGVERSPPGLYAHTISERVSAAWCSTGVAKALSVTASGSLRSGLIVSPCIFLSTWRNLPQRMLCFG